MLEMCSYTYSTTKTMARKSLEPGQLRAFVFLDTTGIDEIVTARRSPWQNPFVERLIGSIRRECLDYVIVLHEQHLRRILSSYFEYYHESRTHLSLNRNSPIERKVDTPENGKVIAIAHVGGLRHRYRRAA